MRYIDPSEQVLVPVIISIRNDTASLLDEMTKELECSLDELLSGIAEDSVAGLQPKVEFFSDVVIPDRVSTYDLLKAFKNN